MTVKTIADNSKNSPAAKVASSVVLSKLKGARWLPSEKLLVLFIIATLPLAGAYLFPLLVPIAVGADIILLVLSFMDYLFIRKTQIQIKRRRDPRLSMGTTNPITLDIHSFNNTSVTIWLRDGYPSEFSANNDRIGTDDEYTQNKKKKLKPGTRGPGLRLAPFRQITTRYELVPKRRGNYVFEDMFIRLQSSLGLSEVAARIPAQEPVIVYPNLRGLKKLQLAAHSQKLVNIGMKRLRREGEGTEFQQLREYLRDDDYRSIDWKATARRQKPITRVYQTERSQNVLICIDAGRMMAARAGDLTKLDYAINAALTVAHTAVKNEDKVGLLVFSDSVHTFLPPKRGKVGYRSILHALARTEPRLCHVDFKKFITFLLAHNRRRSLLILFTDLLDEEQSTPLIRFTKLLIPRHLPLCVTINDQTVLDLAHQLPDTGSEVFDKCVALNNLQERELLKNKLTSQGVHIIDKPPQQITVDTVNKYIEMKRKGVL